MSLETATEQIRAKMAMANINEKVKFDFGDDGLIYVDGAHTPPLISHEDNEAACTLRCSLQTFEGILNGTQDPTMAFMTGKLKVDGSIGLAMKLNGILED